MKHSKRVYLFFGFIFLISLCSYAAMNYIERINPVLTYYGNHTTASSQHEALASGIKPLPPFSFINQDNKELNATWTQGKIWIGDFFFTRCGSICPQMTNNLTTVQQYFRNDNDIKIVSFTCDPEHDDAAKLKEYADRYHANPAQWQFVTGNKKDLYLFARNNLQITAAEGDGSAGDFIHSQFLVLVDKQGFVRGYYDGTDAAQINTLIEDINKLR